MKYFSLVILYLGIFLFSARLVAQQETTIKLNSFLEPTTERKYSYIRTIKREKEYWAYSDRSKKGELVQEGFFTDETMSVQAGHFAFYVNGSKLYDGDFSNGAPKGAWYFYKGGRIYDSLFYNEPLFKPGPANNNNNPVKLVNLTTSRDPDSATFARVEVESAFPGGMDAWRKHLVKNLRFPTIVIETMKPFSKICTVQFIVCTDGTVCDVQAVNSVHPLLDLQAVNAIRKGPEWIPAEQNQRKVKSYKKQPITFSLDY